MEKIGSDPVQTARFIEVEPNRLKEIAAKMAFEASVSGREKQKVFFRLTDDIVLFYDPKEGSGS